VEANPQPPRRRILIGALAGVALAVGVGAAVFFALRPSGPPPAPPPPPPWVLSVPIVVPPAPAELRAAQTAAIDGDADALAALEQQMRAFRSQWSGMPAAVAQKHATADRLMDQGQAVEAARPIASIVETAPAKNEGPLADTRRILIQDAYFRLCRLALSAGQAIVTSVQTHQALALGEPDDPFVINLLLVRAAASDRTGETAQAENDRSRLRSLLSQTSAR
jgi:hypothetical protein